MAKAVKSVQHTAELARRRERRRRRVLMITTGVLIAGLAIFAGYTYWLRDSALVEIKDLEVVGVSSHTEEGAQIIGAVEAATGEMTTLHLKPDLLRDELARFPRVESARIEADFPNGATVTIVERGNGSTFETEGGELLIATDGTVLGTAGAGTDELPEISAGDPPAGPRLEGRTLVQAEVLGAVPAALRPYTEKSDFRKGGVEVTMSNGLVLLFGDASKADQKWKAAASVIADPELSDASYVDLSVPRRPAVRGAEGTVPEAEAVVEEPVETLPAG
jgi:cell division septal protein FtsQ